jgi:uncharacterized protein YndB with AHSA1/START domain
VAVIENSVTINRGREEVFDYLSDPRNELEWNPKVRVMEKLTHGPVGLGTRFRAKWTKSPVVTLECTKYERPDAWCYVNGGPISVELNAALDETVGATTLRTRFDATPHGFMKLLFPIFLISMRKEERRNMDLLKAAIEGRTTPVA